MSGKVKALLVEEGDRVKEGDVLAIIEPDPNEVLRLYQKRAAVESSRLDLQEKKTGTRNAPPPCTSAA